MALNIAYNAVLTFAAFSVLEAILNPEFYKVRKNPVVPVSRAM